MLFRSRGHRADQDAWPAGWGWDDVAESYARSDPQFPRVRPRSPSPLTIDFVESAVATGLPRAYDLNAADNEGVALTPVSILRGRRFGVVDAYLRPAMRRPNLTVLTAAHAVGLLVERGRARGVRYLLDGHEEEAHAARELVLAAGAVDTPRLLMLSGIGPPEALERHGIDALLPLTGVGRNLRDHVANGVLATVDAETLFSAERARHRLSWLVRGRGPLSSIVAEAAACESSSIRERPSPCAGC